MGYELFIIYDLLAVWGFTYLLLGIARHKKEQTLTGIALILLGLSLPISLIDFECHGLSRVLVVIAVLLAVAALQIRSKEQLGKREQR